MIFFFAFLGGIILNLMPCVLPIISIKILTITQDSQSKIKNTFFYVFGVSFSFFVLSMVLIIAKTMGTELGWGFHMQSTGFVMFLMYVFFLMGLNLLGGYQININFKGSQSVDMFFYGMLTTLSSTPCLAPFLGVALGFAITQGNATILLMFQTIALGLSLPYVILVLFPKMLKKIPKTGKWNQSFKEILSFPLFATSIWLLWICVTQTTDTSILVVLFSFLIIYMLIWLINNSEFRFKNLFFVAIFVVCLGSIVLVNNLAEASNDKFKKVDFSVNALEKLLAKNRKVFLVVTANWCLTCKINEQLFLNDAFKKHLKDKKIIYMVADWTNQDDEITKYMHSLNYSGVPMYVFYDNEKKVRILPTILSKQTLLESVK